MASSIQCNPGDVILVPFQFSGGNGVKRRPAVIVSVPSYHSSRADAVMMALTTQTGRRYFGDCDLLDWSQAGLPKPSIVKGVIRTIERSLILRRLGSLTSRDYNSVCNSLRQILGL